MKHASDRRAAPKLAALEPQSTNDHQPQREGQETQSPVQLAWSNPDGAPLLRRLAPPQRHQAILALQRTHGNTAAQRQLPNRKPSSPAIVQRNVTKEIPFLGKQDSIWGDSVSQVTYKPSAAFRPEEIGTVSSTDFPDDGGAVGTIRIPAGSSGTVRVSMQIVVEERGHQPGSPATFQQGFSVTWPVNVATTGDVTIDPGAEHRLPPTSKEVTRSRLSQVKHSFASDNASRRYAVMVNPVVSGTVYKDFSDTTSGPSQTYEFDQPFTLNIEVTKSKPQLGPPFAAPSPPIYFRVKSHRLEDGQYEVLKRFYDGLDRASKDGIANGTAAVSIEGYASTPGSYEDNQDLSRSRGQRVRQLLMDWAGLNEMQANHLRVSALGESSHQRQGEARSERRVDVWIWPFGAP